jgi:hypothetical protein
MDAGYKLLRAPTRLMSAERILPWYYAASVVFLLLDFLAGFNVRVAFLEPWPAARVAYYGVCFACFGLMLWRPHWAALIGSVESLVTLVALILSMAVRVMIPSDAVIAGTASFVTLQEILNFLISGSIAYLAWVKGLRAIRLR